MDILSDLALGFHVALSPINILFCFLGALIGTLVGVLPGIGPVATLAILLPVTFYLPPVPALIMLAGIYYGAQMAARPPPSWSDAGRGILAGDLPRRPRHGEGGPRRIGARDRRARLLLRRHRCDHPDRGRKPPVVAARV